MRSGGTKPPNPPPAPKERLLPELELTGLAGSDLSQLGHRTKGVAGHGKPSTHQGVTLGSSSPSSRSSATSAGDASPAPGASAGQTPPASLLVLIGDTSQIRSMCCRSTGE